MTAKEWQENGCLKFKESSHYNLKGHTVKIIKSFLKNSKSKAAESKHWNWNVFNIKYCWCILFFL